MKNFIKFFVILISGLLILAIVGTRPDTTMNANFVDTQIPYDIEGWLADKESRIKNLRPNTSKEIIWFDPVLKNKTNISIIYIHGFTSSKIETSPTAQLIAKQIGANLYYTRLTGHGRDKYAMQDMSLSNWANDMAQAIGIGKNLGEKVVIISASTGAALSTWAIRQPEYSENILAFITISPNFSMFGKSIGLLNMPWAYEIQKLIYGEYISFPAANKLHDEGWTNEFPTSALMKMGALLKIVSQTDYSKIQIPHLLFYSSQNKIVSPIKAKTVLQQWGGPTHSVEIKNSHDKNSHIMSNHILSGDVFAPNSTQKVVDEAVKWINIHRN